MIILKNAQEFINLSQNYLAVFDYQYSIVSIKGPLEPTLDFQPQEFAKHSVRDFLHPDDLKNFLSLCEIQRKTKSAVEGVSRLKRKNGDHKYVSWRMSSNPKEKLFFLIGNDVTKEHEANVRLNLALASGGFGTWDWDIINNVLTWDDAMFPLFGIKKETSHPDFETFTRILCAGEKERIEAEFETAIAQKENYSSQFKIIHSKLGTRTIRVEAEIIYDHTNKAVRLLGLNWDITDALERDARIYHTSKMSSLGEMAGGISHEINNPLAIISGKAAQIKMAVQNNRIDPQMLINFADKIETTAMRIAKIIKGLRSFARSGDKDPFEPIEVKTIIEDTLELCNARLKSKSVDLRIEEIPSIRIRGRSVQLAQVLLNLLNNAFDAVQDLDERWIKIETVSTSVHVDLVVTDSGNGIQKDLLDKLMQPFFTTKPVGQGTGLGLSISRGLIQEHGGLLFYDSTCPNTRFVIRLPIDQEMIDLDLLKTPA